MAGMGTVETIEIALMVAAVGSVAAVAMAFIVGLAYRIKSQEDEIRVLRGRVDSLERALGGPRPNEFAPVE